MLIAQAQAQRVPIISIVARACLEMSGTCCANVGIRRAMANIADDC
jgi:hypothetical protein